MMKRIANDRHRLPTTLALPLPTRRSGKIFVLLALSLPAVFGLIGLIFDAGMLAANAKDLKHATDAAATAAALEIYLGNPSSSATAQANAYVQNYNGISDATVTVNIPPSQGPYAGQTNCVEVITSRTCNCIFMPVAGGAQQQTIRQRSVAAVENSTAGAAIVVLDPSPPTVDLVSIPLVLPSLPVLLGGLEILGVGNVSVNGAVLDNNTWGGVDQSGNTVGTSAGPPYGLCCTPLVPLTKLRATDIRVSGGVDNPKNYAAYNSSNPSPLEANRRPVPDPLINLPVPTIGVDPTNVNTTQFGGVSVVQLPLIVKPTVLTPGVYDWIQVISGQVVFQPGVYIVRSTNPLTGIALDLAAGTVTATGVMFYITDSTAYDGMSGAPDAGDGNQQPPAPGMIPSVPSVVINNALIGSSYSGLSSPGSPFDGMLIFQRRSDYSAIVIANQQLIGGSVISGRIYAKWGHVLLTGEGSYDMSIVSGTARIVSVLQVTLQPSSLLPPAQDVFLVE